MLGFDIDGLQVKRRADCGDQFLDPRNACAGLLGLRLGRSRDAEYAPDLREFARAVRQIEAHDVRQERAHAETVRRVAEGGDRTLDRVRGGRPLVASSCGVGFFGRAVKPSTR
jgi:hypothetical protein